MMHVGKISSEDVMVLVVKTGQFYSHVYLKMYLHLCIKIFVEAKKYIEQNILRKRRHILC
jgi:hypothetical protein